MYVIYISQLTYLLKTTRTNGRHTRTRAGPIGRGARSRHTHTTPTIFLYMELISDRDKIFTSKQFEFLTQRFGLTVDRATGDAFIESPTRYIISTRARLYLGAHVNIFGRVTSIYWRVTSIYLGAPRYKRDAPQYIDARAQIYIETRPRHNIISRLSHIYRVHLIYIYIYIYAPICMSYQQICMTSGATYIYIYGRLKCLPVIHRLAKAGG